MVRGVERNAELIAAYHDASLFKLLLGRVVAGFAEALKVGRVEENHFITTMGFDVISDGGGNLTTGAGAEDAKRLTPELFEAESFPCCAVVEFASAVHVEMIRGAMAFGLSWRQYRTIQNNTGKKLGARRRLY